MVKAKADAAYVRDEATRTHDGVELLALVTAGENLGPEKFSRGEVSVAKPAHDIVTLTALTTARSSYQSNSFIIGIFIYYNL